MAKPKTCRECPMKTDEYGLCTPSKWVALGVILLFGFGLWQFRADTKRDEEIQNNSTAIIQVTNKIEKGITGINSSLKLIEQKWDYEKRLLELKVKESEVGNEK